MKKSLVLLMLSRICCLSVCCLTLVLAFSCATADASPTSYQDASDLEKMILKRVEEKKKELAAEKARAAKNGNSTASKPLSSAQRPNSTSTRPVQNNSFSNDSAPKAEDIPQEGIPRARPVERETEFAKPTEMRASINRNVDPNVRIRFDFADEEWKDVMEWFAEQAGFSIYFGRSGPPQGTFTYFDSNERSIIEGLDFLNSRLAILQPPHVLIRNGDQLVLVNESEGYPIPLIATVKPDELEEFGEFEVVSCVFDLGKFGNGNQLSLELREDVNQVHLDGFAYIATANRLIIREKVRVLERFRDIIRVVTSGFEQVSVDTYRVQNVEADVMLINLRQLMGFAAEANALEDGTLSFSVQALGDTIYLKGTPDRIDEFRRIAAMIDVPFDDGGRLTEQPYFQVHRVTGDPEVVFQIVQTLLDGEPNVKLDQDKTNGNLYILATKSLHGRVSDLLDKMTGGGDSFAIINLNTLRPMEAVSTLEELLGQDGFEETTGGPRLVADSDNDRIMVYGTPQQILLVQQMVEKIDAGESDTDGPRRRARLITTSSRKAEDIINLLQTPGIMEAMGRKNRLNLILPKDREQFRNRFRFDRGGAPSEDRGSAPMRDPRLDGSGTRTRDGRTSIRPSSYQYESQSKANWRAYYVSTSLQDQDDTSKIGQTTENGITPLDPTHGYQPAEEEKSVPGAPIEVRMTNQGIMILGDDLDAVDDLEAMILDWVEGESEGELPSFFYLQYRKVAEAKGLLEHMLGIESDSGGSGGGGLTGLVGGAISNAVGGSTGDALGGLLGLGGGGGGFSADTAGAIQLEGEDVRLGTDIRFNTLIITGATSNDLDIIAEIIEYVDQPGPPQKPELLGETFTIRVLHRDPMDLKMIVEAQYSEYFKASGQNAQNAQNAQQNVQAQIARQLQQSLQGGRGRNRGAAGGDPDAEQPKATLGVDEMTNSLLVTGPEFIYEQVAALVTQLDVKEELGSTLINPQRVSTSVLVEFAKSTWGNKILIGSEDDEAGGAGTNRNSSSSGRSGGSSSNRGGGGTQGIERAILNQIQQRGGSSSGGRGTPRNRGQSFPNATRGRR